MDTSFPVDMLEYLVCPETHQPLALAEAAVLTRLQAAQQAGTLKNRGGAAVAEPFEQALLRQDGAVAYLVREGIPVMLVEEGVALDGVA